MVKECNNKECEDYGLPRDIEPLNYIIKEGKPIFNVVVCPTCRQVISYQKVSVRNNKRCVKR